MFATKTNFHAMCALINTLIEIRNVGYTQAQQVETFDNASIMVPYCINYIELWVGCIELQWRGWSTIWMCKQ